MSRIGLLDDGVVYPTSDDQPMAESAIHRRCMIDVADTLELWFKRHGRDDVLVGSNNFLYYERGNPRAVVAPDVYVVVGAPAGLRDTYMLWNEPKGPDFVLEVTSKSTRRDDERRKRDVYAALGVKEYFLYDPRAEYLAPPLQGFRLRDGEYRLLPAVTALSNRGVSVASEVLGLELRDEREARRLRLHDRATGEDLLTHEEAEQARDEAERVWKEAERVRKEETAARRAAEARVAELEARLRVLEGVSEPPRAS